MLPAAFWCWPCFRFLGNDHATAAAEEQLQWPEWPMANEKWPLQRPPSAVHRPPSISTQWNATQLRLTFTFRFHCHSDINNTAATSFSILQEQQPEQEQEQEQEQQQKLDPRLPSPNWKICECFLILFSPSCRCFAIFLPYFFVLHPLRQLTVFVPSPF